jgi:sec-independent protein translocase protein TatB
MFDIGFLELLIIGVVALLIMGPERLPGAIRTSALWLSRLRRSFQQIKTEIAREVGVDEIKQQLHNENIMDRLEKTKSDTQENFQHASDELKTDIDKLQNNISDVIDDAHEETPTSETITAEPANNRDSNPA